MTGPAPIRRSAAGWSALLAALPVPMREEVRAAYAAPGFNPGPAPGRHYHDGEHVGGIWATWLALGGAAEDRAILWAAAYHDLVYEIPSASGWNEAESARRLTQIGAALRLDAAPLAEAVGMIEATARHLTAVAERDRLFCDLDLAGLACDPAGFRDNTERVRREYAMVPEPAFRAGRRAFLAGLLAEPAIFRSGRVPAWWEATARANIRREVAEA
ncbi:MAG: metal-dependent phosphohydrolase [Belnapia sp.]|nr:metal-dependent phosphohydrolase [Belnapia sp.]